MHSLGRVGEGTLEETEGLHEVRHLKEPVSNDSQDRNEMIRGMGYRQERFREQLTQIVLKKILH